MFIRCSAFTFLLACVALALVLTITESRSFSIPVIHQTVTDTSNNNNNQTSTNSNGNPNNTTSDTSANNETNDDPLANAPVVGGATTVSECDKPETYGVFDPKNCKQLAEMVRRVSSNNREPVAQAILILLYFAGLSFIVFSLLAIIRIHVFSARSPFVMRACWVLGVSLFLVATLMPIMRALLEPFDAQTLGLTKRTLGSTMECCMGRSSSNWPEDEKGFVREDLYIGEPPRNKWPFWLVLAACFATALTLTTTIILVRLEDTRGARRGKAGLPIFECDCEPESCVHKAQPTPSPSEV